MSEIKTLITKDILQARIANVREIIAQVNDAWLLKELQGILALLQYKVKYFEGGKAQLEQFISLLNNHKVQRIEHRYIEDLYWYIDDKQVYQEYDDNLEYCYLLMVRGVLNFGNYVEEVDIDVTADTPHEFLEITEYRLRELSRERLNVQ